MLAYIETNNNIKDKNEAYNIIVKFDKNEANQREALGP